MITKQERLSLYFKPKLKAETKWIFKNYQEQDPEATLRTFLETINFLTSWMVVAILLFVWRPLSFEYV